MLTIILLTINLGLFWLVLTQRRRRENEPPLIKHNIPFIGAALEFGKDHIKYLQKIQQKCGDCFTVNIAGWYMHFFMNPLDIRYLDQSSSSVQQTPVLEDFVTRMVGPCHGIRSGYSRENSSIYNIQKNLRSPMERKNLLQVCTERVSASIIRIYEDQYGKLEAKIDLFDFCTKIVFDVSMAMFCGYGQGDTFKETKKFYKFFSEYNEDSAYLVDRIPIHLLPKTKAARKKLLDLFSTVNWRERNNVSQLLKGIVKINNEKGETANIPSEALIILWASLANTVPALFWTIYHILSNKSALNDIYREIENISPYFLYDKSCETPFEIDELTNMVVLESCIHESLRLCGFAMAIRKVTKPVTVRTHDKNLSYKLREGDYTAVFAPVANANGELYENPEMYKHLRFVEKSPVNNEDYFTKIEKDSNNNNMDNESNNPVSSKLHFRRGSMKYQDKALANHYTHLTFGYGASRCPGRHVALGEIKLIVINLLRRYKCELFGQEKTLGFNLTHLGFGVMPPDHDVKVLLTPKNQLTL